MKIEIRDIQYGGPEYQAAVALRQELLRTPLGLKFTDEELALEANDVHMGFFADGALLACLILKKVSDSTVRMRQVVVNKNVHGSGIGSRLVLAAEDVARDTGFTEVVLTARESAVDFYLGLGYEFYGEAISELGLPHRSMRRVLK